MKKVFAALTIGIVFVVILLASLANKSGDSPSSIKGQAYEEDSIQETLVLERELVSPLSKEGEELEAPGEAVEQIMIDISDANVPESTEDLKYAFSRLNEICEKAIETCSAMLTARYGNRQEESVNNEKGDENGNE
jgi:hypothetical protein